MFEKIITIVVLLICISFFYSIMEEIKNRRLLREHEMLMKIQISENDLEIIDKIINEEIVKYRVINIDHKKSPFITDDQQKEMVKTILSETLNSLSPIFYERCTFIYNKDKFEDIVYNKVLMAVLALTVEINGSYSEV